MKVQIILAVIFSILLFLMLWLRPVIGEIGTPTAPNVSGTPSQPLPAQDLGFVSPDTVATPAPSPAATKVSKEDIIHSEEIEAKILSLTNEERKKNGLTPLEADQNLRDIARGHSDDMIVRNFFEHVNPDGLSPDERIAVQDRRLIGIVGENIWKGTGCTAGSPCNPADPQKLAAQIVDGWMKSPGHRANILRKDYTYLGVGLSTREGVVMATQNFAHIAARLNQPIPPIVNKGTILNLTLTSGNGTRPAEKYDLWITDRGISAGDAKPLLDSTIQAQPGIYKLRFYFPVERGFEIYYGPQIEVKKS